MCEGLTNPTALLDLHPEFTWKFSDADSPDNQSAYQILVASTSEGLAADTGDVWDSGKVASVAGGASLPETIALKRGSTYYWKVKTWDNLDAQGPYSAEQTFTLKSIFLPFWAEILISAVGAAAIGSGLVWFLMRRKSGPAG
jgi:alpha-L-rhamnosidase